MSDQELITYSPKDVCVKMGEHEDNMDWTLCHPDLKYDFVTDHLEEFVLVFDEERYAKPFQPGNVYHFEISSHAIPAFAMAGECTYNYHETVNDKLTIYFEPIYLRLQMQWKISDEREFRRGVVDIYDRRESAEDMES